MKILTSNPDDFFFLGDNHELNVSILSTVEAVITAYIEIFTRTVASVEKKAHFQLVG